jgi:hypothetical protein
MTQSVADIRRLLERQEEASSYFTEIFARQDAAIEEDDSPDVQLQKLTKQGEILGRLITLVETPAFRDVRPILADVAHDCEAKIFPAYLKGDKVKCDRLAIIHEGVAQLSDCFQSALAELQNVVHDIAKLKEAPADDLQVPNER